MELTRLRPYSFDSMHQAFELHLGQVQYYLTRHYFSEHQYRTRTMPLNARTLTHLVLQTTLNWSVILLLTLNHTGWFTELSVINRLTEQALNIRKIDLFNATFLMMFILWEDTCLFSFWLLVTYRNTKLQVLFHLKDSLDCELTWKSRRQLLCYFVRTTYLAGIFSKCVACGLALFSFKLTITTCKLYRDGQIQLSELFIGLYYCVSVNLYFVQLMYAFFSLVTGLFLVVKIFRMKLSKCSGVMKLAASFASGFMFRVFCRDYIELHRLVNMYNYTIKEYILTLSYATKLSATLTIIYLAKQDHFTHFSALFLCLYLAIYLYHIYLQLRLSHFASKNIEIYRHVTYFAARNQWKASSLESFTFGNDDRLFVSQNVLFRCKIDFMVDFLSNGMMGFTLGRQYYITKAKVMEDFLLNTYMLMLMYKKIKL